MPNSIAGRLSQTAITVSATATSLPTTAQVGRRTILIYNNGSVSVFVGNSAVTTASGIPIPPATSLPLDLAESVVLYGIVTAGNTADVRVLEGA